MVRPTPAVRTPAQSGGWGYRHIEGDGDGLGVVLARIPSQSERNGLEAFLLGLLTCPRPSAIDVESRHTVVPVFGLIVLEDSARRVVLMYSVSL